MKTELENYSDQEYQLYEVVRWAMLGLISTVNLARPALFGGFLFDLFLDPSGGDLSGEPGWSLQRIELSENFCCRHSYINDANMKKLTEWCGDGEAQAFWIDTAEQEQFVISNFTFWKVVADAFADFVKERPERKKELDIIVTDFPQLQR